MTRLVPSVRILRFMTNLKIACWNVYFSHTLIGGDPGSYRVAQQARADNVAEVIYEIDPHLFGIVECMPRSKLEFFRDAYMDPGYGLVVEGDASRLNLGLLYWAPELEVTQVPFGREAWLDQIGDDPQPARYRFARTPLITLVRHKVTGAAFVLAVVHPKSKKTYSADPDERRQEALRNRKRIVAEGRRLRAILHGLAASLGPPYDRFLIMGDINDGPGFDAVEAAILRSGVETHIGSVLDPARLLYSFVDLSDEVGIPTTPSSWGAPQLDHVLYTRQLAEGPALPRIVSGSGRVRSDLVDFASGSGKDTDSDHIPVEVLAEA